MNILFFSQYYYPEPFLINEIAPALVKKGHQVTVVTGLPNYPSGVIESEYRRKDKRFEILAGVRIVRCPIIPRGRNKFQLLMNYVSYMFSAQRSAQRLKEDFDIVISYQLTPILQVYPAIRYAKKNKKKLLMYNLDLAPMCGSGYIQNKKIVFSLYSKLSRRLMNACDHIAVTSKSFIEYNHKVNGVPMSRMTYLPQHASDVMVGADMKAKDNGVSDFMFAGNIAHGSGLDTVIAAAIKLKPQEKFRIHIVGDGSYLETLKAKVKNASLTDRFVFHGRYPQEEMPDIYREADALLITLRAGQITVPAKLQNYMATGKPIFGAMDGSGKDIINDVGCGVCVSAEDSDGLCEIMRDYIRNTKRYEMCGTLALNYFKANFTLDTYVENLLQIVSGTLGTNCIKN